jgi:hypothetical protein
MHVFSRLWLIARSMLLTCLLTTALQAQNPWSYSDGKYTFAWDLKTDKASFETSGDHAQIWSGSLLPGFWIQTITNKRFIKATVDAARSTIKPDALDLALTLGSYGTGKLTLVAAPWGLRISQLSIRWSGKAPAIIEMYFGATPLTQEQLAWVSDPERPFAPDWAAFGFCVPGAKEGPAQSYFRSWDFGRADIALGSYGPSMGSPYGAAFPRPTLSASMGHNNGWITFGAGSIPDAAMTLYVRSARGSIQYLYREDLWGAPQERDRVWNEPLRITWGENAWASLRKYTASIPTTRVLSPIHQRSVWNTWGNWRFKDYAIAPIAEMAQKVGAGMLVLDDPWEGSSGSGSYDQKKFPDFMGDIDRIHKLNMQHGIWETLAWLDDPYALGLTNQELILDRNGVPCKGSWNFDPFGANHYLLDISTDKARNFLIARTKRVMKELKPKLIKLDFGYGISNANVGVPRNLALRGERYSYELTKTIVDAAKSIDPEVTIMYYCISPLFQSLFDMVSLDDQGDLWYDHAEGHSQWSIWASLLSQHQVALNASSGYDWRTDDEIILNTAVLGSPGSVLGNKVNNGPVTDQYINRRYAINAWFRKTISWEPAWFNTDFGGMETPMQLNCWGRTEKINGQDALVALALRPRNKEKLNGTLPASYQWTGRWALIAQDQHDISTSEKLAVIPFDAQTRISFPFKSKPEKVTKVSFRSSVPYTAWTWKDGVLTLTFEGKDASLESVAGFVISIRK